MAELKVDVIKIDTIEVHPNADRMELAIVGGYQICVQLGTFRAGDLAVYIPVDAVLPEELEAYIFGPDSKVKLHKHRVRAIKLRGAVSQGMLMSIDSVFGYFNGLNKTYRLCLGDDLTEPLGITKFQPLVKHTPGVMQGKRNSYQHSEFPKYTSIGHLRKYWGAFKDGDKVYLTEKIHGTNFRCGWVPYRPRTIWQKFVKNILRLGKSWEFVYGSHNVQLGDHGTNVYKTIVDTRDLKEKIPHGQVWYGEIFGPGIQKNYGYGITEGHHAVAFFDIRDVLADKYLDFSNVIKLVKSVGEHPVPYTTMQYDSAAIAAILNDPKRVSFIDSETSPIEGFVVRPKREKSFPGGRLILKLLSYEYLLAMGNTDFH